MTLLTSDIIKEGDDVLLWLKTHKDYLIKAEKGKSFHTHKGFINFDDVIGKEYGSRIPSSLGIEFVVLKPLIRDYIMKSSRQTQITYPKDIALIMMFSGISPGSRVVEAGTGTGALTIALAHCVKPYGKIYSYDIRAEFQKTAERNLRRAGVLDVVELKSKDVTVGIDETDVDAVILDLAVPWLVVPHAYRALKAAGTLVSFSPTIDQVVRTYEALKDESFIENETVECMMRGMQTDRGKTRPHTLMTGHSGYITYGRKTLKSETSNKSDLESAETGR